MLQELFRLLGGSTQFETMVLAEAKGLQGGTSSREQRGADIGERARSFGGAEGRSGDHPTVLDARCVHQALLAVGVAINAALMGSLVTLLEGHEEQGSQALTAKEKARRWYNDAMEAQRQQLTNATRSVSAEQWKQSFLRAASDRRGVLGAVNAEEFVGAVRFSVITQAKNRFSTEPLPAWPQSLKERKQQKESRALVVHSSVVRQIFAYLDQTRAGKVEIAKCVRFFAERGSVRARSVEISTELFDRCWLLLSGQQQMLDVKSISRNLFSAIDPSRSGYTSEAQLRAALKKREILLSDRELKALTAALDKDGDGRHVSTESFERNLRDAKRRSDLSLSANRQSQSGCPLPSKRVHEQVPAVKKPPFAEWETAAAQRSGESVPSTTAKAVTDTAGDAAVPLAVFPRPGRDDGHITADTIETFSHRVKAPPLWAAAALGSESSGGGVPVSFESREYAMARALRQALRDAIRRKRRVYGQVLQTPTDIFRVFDRDGTGKLSADDLKQALTKLGLGYTAQQLHLLSEFLDTNGDGAIDYREMVRGSRLALPLIASYATDLSSCTGGLLGEVVWSHHGSAPQLPR